MEDVKYIPGDLVEFCNRIQRIENIDKQTSYRVSISLEHGYFVDKPEEILKFLKPIPLTPTILEANDWMKGELEQGDNASTSYYTYSKKGCIAELRYYQSCDMFLPFIDQKVLINIIILYVHQLQHLLFGLGLNSELKV